MQNRLKIALVVAVFFSLIAAYGIYNFLRQKKLSGNPATELRTSLLRRRIFLPDND
jgi:hypothetical protein